MRTRLLGAAAACGMALAVAACSGPVPKHERPLGFAIQRDMDLRGMDKDDPILMRIFKEESELEVWKKDGSGKYALLKTYEICKWSGELGPKHKEGDRQAPEGFYQVTPANMNPNSSYHLSFNLGFPNTFDRAHARTGSHLMVHGDCQSAGCYAMEDEQIEEIYALAREAFRGGQKAFQVQAYPFRMTPQNLARHRNDPNKAFWRNLKEGNDHFEVTRAAPQVGVCDRRYVFNASNGDLDPSARCPVLDVPEAIRVAVAEKARQDDKAMQVAIARLESGVGGPPVSADVQIAQAGDTAPQRGATASGGESGGLLSRMPRLRVPGLSGGQRQVRSQQASPVATAVTGYAPQPAPVAGGNDPFAVFDLFVTVDARTLPKAHAERSDAAGTR